MSALQLTARTLDLFQANLYPEEIPLQLREFLPHPGGGWWPRGKTLHSLLMYTFPPGSKQDFGCDMNIATHSSALVYAELFIILSRLGLSPSCVSCVSSPCLKEIITRVIIRLNVS